MSIPYPVRLEVQGEDPDNPQVSLRDDEGHSAAAALLLDMSRPLSPELDWLQFLWNYRLGLAEDADAVAFGDDLAKALFGEGPLALAWAAIGGSAGERPLHLTLSLGPGGERFSALPLELLRDNVGFVFARDGAALTRTLLEAEARVAQVPREPRVLMAWACPPGTGKFDPSPHTTALSALFGERLQVVGDASFDGITRALREAHLRGQPFDVLHVLAHGSTDAGLGGLCLNRPTGGIHRVNAEPFAAGLRGMGLSLAFFCACQSAVSGPGSSFVGLGQQVLSENGGDLPCAIAAQANLPVVGSAKLAEGFYRQLLDGVDPARALAEARRAAFADGGAAWSAPVCYTRPAPLAAAAAPVGVDMAPLPVRKETWQDRPESLTEGRQQLRQGRLVSVVGLPGVGKSELGIELGRALIAEGAIDRAIYLPIQRGHSPGAVRARLATALQMAAVPADDRLMAGALASVPDRLLLLLDDAEGLLRDREMARATRAMLDAWLGVAPRLRVLLTTRWQVGNTRESERALRVSSLDAAATAALLRAEIEALGVWRDSFSAEEDWPKLLAMLDGHPRSTVLIARHFNLPGASVRQIVRRLETLRASAVVEPDLLGQPDGGLDDNERARLESLVASMDLSFEVLREQSPDAVVAFAALSLFPAGLPEAVATAVAGGDGIGLMQLLRLNLVEWRDGRTRYPLPIRWYAERVRKTVSLDETTTRRHALGAFAELAHGWYQKVLAGQGPSIVAEVLAEEQNLLELSAWAEVHGDADAAPSPMALVARYVDSALTLASREDTQRLLLTRGLVCARRLGDKLGQANMLRHLGDLEVNLDNPAAALPLLREAQTLAAETGDTFAMAGTWRGLGDALARMDDEDGARAAFEAAIPLYQQVGIQLGEANAQRSLGELLSRLNERPAAIAALDRALTLFRGLGDIVGEANVLITRADARALGGDIASARGDAARALELYRAAKARVGEANALRVMSDLLDRSGELSRADEMLRRAISICRETRDRLGEANALRSLGALRLRQDERDEARQALEQAQTLFSEVKATISEGSCCVTMAELLLLEGDAPGAKARLERALALYKESRSQLGEANALSVLGEVFIRTGQLAEAQAALTESLRLYRALHEATGSSACLRRLADLARLSSNFPRAMELLGQAAEVATRSDLPLELATITAKRAELALLTGDAPTADAGYRQAIALYQAQQSDLGVANAQLGLAEALRVQGDRAGAKASAESALAGYRGIGDGLGVANTQNLLGMMLMEEGALSAAFTLFVETAALYEQVNDVAGRARARENMARCALSQGAAAQGLALSEEVLALSRTLSDAVWEAQLLYLQFQGFQAAQDLPGVMACGALLRARAESFGDAANLTWWTEWLNKVRPMAPAELIAALDADAEALRGARVAEARGLIAGQDLNQLSP